MARTTIISTKKGPVVISERERPKAEGRRRPDIQIPATTGERGQPAVYDPVRFPHIANVLCKERGFTSEELARVFGVGKKTVDMWMRTHEEFRDAVRQGKFEFDTQHVEQALLKRALGYTVAERTTKSIYLREKDDAGKVVKIPAKEVSVVEKIVLPDIKAITFWLTNRRPEDWKMTVNVKGEQTITNTQISVSADLDNMNEEQLIALRDMVVHANNAMPTNPKLIEMTPIDDLLDSYEATTIGV
jgi:hypothetical protein